MANNFEYKIHVSIDQTGIKDDVKKALADMAKEIKNNAYKIELTGDPKKLVEELMKLKKIVPNLDLTEGLHFDLADAIKDNTEQGKKIIDQFASYIINSVNEAVSSIDTITDSIKNTENVLKTLKDRRKELVKDDGSADAVAAFEKAEKRFNDASTRYQKAKQEKGKFTAAEDMKQAYQDMINYQKEANKQISNNVIAMVNDTEKSFHNANGELVTLKEHMQNIKVNSSYKEDLKAIESGIFENENRLTQLKKDLESAQNPELKVKGKLADNFLDDLQSQLDQMTSIEVKVKPKIDKDVKLEVEVEGDVKPKNDSDSNQPSFYEHSNGQLSIFKEEIKLKHEDAEATEELHNAEQQRIADIPGQMSLEDFTKQASDATKKEADAVKRSQEEIRKDIEHTNTIIGIQKDWLRETSIVERDFKTSGKGEANDQLRRWTRKLIEYRRYPDRFYGSGTLDEDRINVGWYRAYKEAERQGSAPSVLSQNHTDISEYNYNNSLQNLIDDRNRAKETLAEAEADLQEYKKELQEAISAPPNTSGMDKVEEELHEEAAAHRDNEEAAKADAKAQEEFNSQKNIRKPHDEYIGNQIKFLQDYKKVSEEYNALEFKDSEEGLTSKEESRLGKLREKIKKYDEILKQYSDVRVRLKNGESYSIINDIDPSDWNTKKSAIEDIVFELKEEAAAAREVTDAINEEKKVEDQIKTGYRAYNRVAGIKGEEGISWFSDNLETMKSYVSHNPDRNVIKKQIDTSQFFKLDAHGAEAKAITYLGDQSDEASKKITEVYNKIQVLKKELAEKPSNALSEELKNLELEYDALSEDESNIYGTHSSTQFALRAKKAGYKGIEISDVVDDYNMESGKTSTTIALFDNEALKETEDITSQIRGNIETTQQAFDRQSAITSHADFLLSREDIDETETDIDILTNKLEELNEENRLVSESAETLGEKLREITTATSEGNADIQNIKDYYSSEIGDVFDKETDIGKYYDYLVQNTDFGTTEEEVSAAYERIAQKIIDFQKEVNNIVRSKIESIIGGGNQAEAIKEVEKEEERLAQEYANTFADDAFTKGIQEESDAATRAWIDDIEKASAKSKEARVGLEEALRSSATADAGSSLELLSEELDKINQQTSSNTSNPKLDSISEDAENATAETKELKDILDEMAVDNFGAVDITRQQRYGVNEEGEEVSSMRYKISGENVRATLDENMRVTSIDTDIYKGRTKAIEENIAAEKELEKQHSIAVAKYKQLVAEQQKYEASQEKTYKAEKLQESKEQYNILGEKVKEYIALQEKIASGNGLEEDRKKVEELENEWMSLVDKLASDKSIFNQLLENKALRGIDTLPQKLQQVSADSLISAYGQRSKLQIEKESFINKGGSEDSEYITYLDERINKTNSLIESLRQLEYTEEQRLNIQQAEKDAEAAVIKQTEMKAAADKKAAEAGKQSEQQLEQTRSALLKQASALTNNGKLMKYYGEQVNSYIEEIGNTSTTQERLAQIRIELNKISAQATIAGQSGKTFFQILKQRSQSLVAYLSTFASFYRIAGYIRQSILTIVELDTQLVDLRKTTTMTSSELNEFYRNSTELGKQLGVTTNEIISQAAAWSRLGYSSQEAATQMAQMSSKFASISPGMTTDQSTDYLVSTMQAYGIAVDDVERKILDNVNKIGKKLPKHMATYGAVLIA